MDKVNMLMNVSLICFLTGIICFALSLFVFIKFNIKKLFREYYKRREKIFSKDRLIMLENIMIIHTDKEI